MFEKEVGSLNNIIRKLKNIQNVLCLPISALYNVILRMLWLNIEATEISI